MMISKFKKRVGTLILAATMGMAAIMPVKAGYYEVLGSNFLLNADTYYKSVNKVPKSKTIFLTVLFEELPQRGNFHMSLRQYKNGQYTFYNTTTVTVFGNSLSTMKRFDLKQGNTYQACLIGETAIGKVKEFRYLEQ